MSPVDRSVAECLTAIASATFPFRLTPFEEYLLADERLGNDMEFFLRIDLAGVVEERAMEAAIRGSADRHPMTKAVVAKGLLRSRWQYREDVSPAFYVERSGTASNEWRQAPDLKHRSGVRFLLRQEGSHATLTIKVHHVCCDGIGALQLVGDVLARYAMLMGDSDGLRLGDVDCRRLTGRGRVPGKLRGVNWFVAHLREVHRVWWQIPRELRAVEGRADAGGRRDPIDELVEYQFTSNETRRLLAAASRDGSTLNDLLLRDMFRTLADWNISNSSSEDPWFRINMPMSLRTRDDVATPAANIMSMAFLNRRRSEIANDSLLRGIREESESIRRTLRGTLLLDGLAFAAWIPGLLSAALSLPICMSTAILTNVGDPTRRFTAKFPRQDGLIKAGNLVVQRITGVPPLRPGTHVAVGTGVYAKRLSLTVRMTPELFGPEDSARFLRMFVEKIRESSNSTSEADNVSRESA